MAKNNKNNHINEAEEVKNEVLPTEEVTNETEETPSEPEVEEVQPEVTPTYNLVAVKPFTDKYDKTKHYSVGDKLLNLTKERYEELKAHVAHIVEDLK